MSDPVPSRQPSDARLTRPARDCGGFNVASKAISEASAMRQQKWLRLGHRPVHHAGHDVTALPVDVYALAAPPCGGWGLRSRAVDET